MIANRPIRSYVLREGRITKGQLQALSNYWTIYGIVPNEGLFDFAAIFQRQAPIILEIGFGSGQSLAIQAAKTVEHNFMGIEVHRPGIGNLLLQLAKQDLKNVRIIEGDAVAVLQQNIPEQSLDKIQIFFPDPWPKKRHHKRRLLQPDFIDLLAKKLKIGGLLHFATDWQDYAVASLAHLSNNNLLINTAKDFIDRPCDRPLTKFEQRGQRLGHGVWDLLFVRR